LAIVLICGLLSSTFLVITVFPYYYLGTEFVRLHISRKACLTWLGLSIATMVGLGFAGAAKFMALAPIGVLILQVLIIKLFLKKRRK